MGATARVPIALALSAATILRMFGFPLPQRFRPTWSRLLLGGATLGVTPLPAAPSETAPPPALAVVVVVDQLRGDYLDRFQPHFVEGGFNRFLRGAVYTNAHYRHALTATAPGHATLLTGAHAREHGIIGNDWRDGVTLQQGNSVDDAAHPLVGTTGGPSAGPRGVWAGRQGASPHRLLASTVGDQLKLRHGTRSRVIAVGLKDRSPILMGGRLADAAYWLHEGRFVTSTYYRAELPEWVVAFNAEQPVDATFGQTWERLLAPELYDAVQGPDSAEGKSDRYGLGTAFPHRLDGGAASPGRDFYEAYRLTPYSNVVVAALAQRALQVEQLGQSEGPDLLCLGFSQLDYAGHAYGPDSHEVMDSMIRLDRVLAEFFAELDRLVGAENYVAVLSADHGVAPLPERVRAIGPGLPAGRFASTDTDLALQRALDEAFGALPEDLRWTVRDGYGYRLLPASLQHFQVDREAAAQVVKTTLLQSEQIVCAWTRGELRDHPETELGFLAPWQRSVHAERSPDVVFSLRPYFVDMRPAGTNHGSPHSYDTHVPLAWFGAGITPGRHHQRVGTDQLAPTLARRLGVPVPTESRADPLF